MVFEAHGMSFPCTELLLFNYAKVNTVFYSMAPLSDVSWTTNKSLLKTFGLVYFIVRRIKLLIEQMFEIFECNFLSYEYMVP